MKAAGPPYLDARFGFRLGVSASFPDNPAGFGGERAVRNFVRKLSGATPHPLSGNYGGLVTIDYFPGVLH